MNREVAQFFYSPTVPDRAIALAKVSSLPSTPAELVDVNDVENAVPELQPGPLVVTGNNNGVLRQFDAKALGNAVAIGLSQTYYLKNQFFEITHKTSDGTTSGNPLFYRHMLPADVNDVTVLAFDGSERSGFLIEPGSLWHSFSGEPMSVRYYSGRVVHVDLLQYAPAMRRGARPDLDVYTLQGGVLRLSSSATHFVRFTEENGYRVLPPHNVLPNDPWYPRIRFSITPPAPEWARQMFLPRQPWMLASWVPGKALSSRVVEFERKPMMVDPGRRPDILVFDKDYQVKFALDGSDEGSPKQKGFLYPWKRSQFARNGVDAAKARVHLLVDVEPTDLIFGFYLYAEPDVIYRDIDVNPFTNQEVRDRVVEFFWKNDPAHPFERVFYRILQQDGSPISGATNDPNPASGPGVAFGRLIAGASAGLNDFTVNDVRVRGGGLDRNSHGIPQAAHCWDIGYWDGKPYPAGGAMAVYLPASVLQPEGSFTRNEVVEKVRKICPVGVVPVVRFYGPDGQEIY